MCAARSTRIVERMSDALGVPRDVTLDLPRAEPGGQRQLVLENHKGIIEFFR